jgi:hypothetical protein
LVSGFQGSPSGREVPAGSGRSTFLGLAVHWPPAGVALPAPRGCLGRNHIQRRDGQGSTVRH